MTAPQGSFAPTFISGDIQGISSLTTSRPEREQRDRERKDLEPERWVGSMDVTSGGATLSRPASRLSRNNSLRPGSLQLSSAEEEHINTDWAMSEEVSLDRVRPCAECIEYLVYSPTIGYSVSQTPR
jgi:hypothetical protein